MKRKVKIGVDIAILDIEWECETNPRLKRRLNTLFPQSANIPGRPHITEQAATYFGGEVLNPLPLPDPNVVY